MSSTVYDDGARWLRPRGLPMADQAAPPALPPFDEKTYLLGYQVFLENGKLQDAWLLASAAVVTSMKPLGFIAAAIADGVTETQVLLPDGDRKSVV